MPENEQIFCYDCVYSKIENYGKMVHEGCILCRKYEIQVNLFSSCGAGQKIEKEADKT